MIFPLRARSQHSHVPRLTKAKPNLLAMKPADEPGAGDNPTPWNRAQSNPSSYHVPRSETLSNAIRLMLQRIHDDQHVNRNIAHVPAILRPVAPLQSLAPVDLQSILSQAISIIDEGQDILDHVATNPRRDERTCEETEVGEVVEQDASGGDEQAEADSTGGEE
jgi:hypothetical protein